MLYIVGIILLIVLAVFKKILLDPLYECCFKKCCGSSNTSTQVAPDMMAEESPKEDFTYSDDFFRDLKIRALKDIHSKTENEINDFKKVNSVEQEKADQFRFPEEF